MQGFYFPHQRICTFSLRYTNKDNDILKFWKDHHVHRMTYTPEESGTKGKDISFEITAVVLGRELGTWTKAVI